MKDIHEQMLYFVIGVVLLSIIAGFVYNFIPIESADYLDDISLQKQVRYNPFDEEIYLYRK